MFNKSIKFVSLDLRYSNDTAFNKLILTNLAVITRFETEHRKKRQRQGIEAAKKTGKYRGGKTIITKKVVAQVQDLKENKKLSVIQIAKITEKSQSTIYKVLKEYLNYKPANRLVKTNLKLLLNLF
jgi:DNA invertase Pin-like site-specific DNA recombinase|uniref:Putative serine recombinase n=1 Tax=Fistulifera solaris TaxID=1519565 RepID=F3Y7F8_FISSO|nr:putative serine recombinase [Fistulifera solaris]BAK19003.1 putative serine recombinase [Fistulifera solaris]